LGALVGLEDHDRLFTGLSLTHANAQLITLGNALSARLPLVITRQFTKSRLWEILAHYECTTFNLLGGMATAILAEPPGDFDRAHRVRFVLSAGMPEKMWRAFERRFGVKVFEFFGAAEGGLTLNPPGVGPVGSIGKAAPGSVCEILDDHDRIAAPGVRGEICFRNADGTVAPVTYFGDAQASAAKTRGGWFRTGDIGWKDEAGWIYFSHRDGHSTRRNGAFIDIAEIETAMADLPGVEDVHVYGVSTIDNAPGEKEVVAAVVPGVGFCGAIEVLVQSAKLVGASSAPSFIQLVDEIPKTASEKPQARHLIDMIRNGSTPVFNRSGPIKLRLAEGGRI
jgi:crotonobetaine/carnitine-CoA ligase